MQNPVSYTHLHYGCGKTNLALNLALTLRRKGEKVGFATAVVPANDMNAVFDPDHPLKMCIRDRHRPQTLQH